MPDHRSKNRNGHFQSSIRSVKLIIVFIIKSRVYGVFFRILIIAVPYFAYAAIVDCFCGGISKISDVPHPACGNG